MPEIQELRCKTCDAVLDLSTALGGVVECAFCHNKYTVPKEETRSDTRELLQIASHELDTCTFDRAYTAYSKAAQTDEKEPEAFFGMALSEFKVQYLKDAARKHLQPICHDITDKKFSDDKNYKKALSLATPAQKKVYAQRAEEIDAVSKEFNRLKNNGVHYDCFICVKVTDKDEKGNQINTQDSYEALKLYNHLKKRGYSPFYSEEEIRGKAGAEYEATILYALFTSECMLVVCSNDEYLQTPWVKNEYTRFMELINDERKDADAITIVFKGKPIERLPGKRALIQGVNLNNGDAYTSIEDFVESHTPEAKKRRQEIAATKARQEEEIRRQIEEQKRAQRELEEKLKSIQTQTFAAPAQSAGASATVQSLLIRAKQEKKDGNKSGARDYYNKVIDADPQNAEAWWGMFLLDMDVEDSRSVVKKMDPQLFETVTKNRNYRNACEYASGAIKEEIDDFNAGMKNPMMWYANFISELGGKSEKDVLGNMTAAKVSRTRSSKNLAIAESFATPEVKEHIAHFKDRLESSDTYFQLFLEESRVKNENEILSSITDDMRAKVEKSENFKLALKKQDKASPEYAKRISSFYDALYGAETEWKLFLQDMNVTDEYALFENCEIDLRERVNENEHYERACNKKGETTAAMRDRIDRFSAKLNSPETAWNIILNEYNVKSGSALADKIDAEDMKMFAGENHAGDETDKILGEYYAEVKRYAEGKTKDDFHAFEKKAHSYDLWHDKLLRTLGAKTEQDYLDNKFSYAKTKDIMVAVGVAGQFANAEQKGSLDAFVEQLMKQHDFANKALESWKAVQKKLDAKSDDEMTRRTFRGKMSDFKETKEAVKYASESKDKKLKERFEKVINEQEARIAGEKSAGAKRKLSNLFTVLAIALPALMFATAVFAAIGISPIWELWTVWYYSVKPSKDWIALPIVLGLIFTIVTIVMRVKQNGTKPFAVMRVLSVLVSGVIFITAFAFLPAGLRGTELVYVHDNCVELYAENDTGYTFAKFDYTDSSRTSFEIPSEYHGKKVTAIDSSAFEGSSTLTSITIPETVTKIGWHAFDSCSSLTSITLPEGVTSIGGGAFHGCESLASINIPASVVSISEYAFSGCDNLKSVIFDDKNGWGASAEDLSDPENAAKLLRETKVTSIWVKTAYAKIEKNGLIRCDCAWLRICDVNGRTYIKDTDELAYAALVYSSAGYTGPMLVGTTETSVRYKVGNYEIWAKGSFEYNGKTYFYSEGEYYMGGDHRNNDRGIYTCENRDLLEAAKEIAALISEAV